jgi:3-isopropylmalate/(R)-2-methylmalate dehydratase large subunit
MPALTIAEKIISSHAAEGVSRAGEMVTVTPDIVMLNDVSGPIALDQFRATGAVAPFAPDGVVLVADHFAPATSIASAEGIAALRSFARAHGLKHFYEPGRGGIEHNLLAELGLVGHGSLVFGADSHTCTAGAFNALGIGFGSTDLAAALAAGSLWLRVPDSIRVTLTGAPGAWVTGKDIILELIRRIGVAGAVDAAIEFGGRGVAMLSMDERMAIANMAVEAGADTCAFHGDARSGAYMAESGMAAAEPVAPDRGADYVAAVEIDLAALGPLVACPPSPGNAVPVGSLAGQRVDQVYVGNCANGTLTDLRQAASMLRGRRIAPGVRMIVVPATQKIWRAALAEGLLEVFAAAGAAVSTPTCGACFGGHMGVLAAGEVAIATTNRNFRGRMGDPGGQVFLANAWVAAAAAVAGEIVAPGAWS